MSLTEGNGEILIRRNYIRGPRETYFKEGGKCTHKSSTQVAVTSLEPPEETALTTSGLTVIGEN